MKKETLVRISAFCFSIHFCGLKFFAKYSSLVVFFGKISRIFTEKNLKIVVKWQDFSPQKKKVVVLAGPQIIAGFFHYSTFPSIFFHL
jgi:hypothetical protein